MTNLKPISYRDMDAVGIPDGMYLRYVPDLTRDNIKFLVDKHNELVEAFNQLNGNKPAMQAQAYD